MTFAKIETDGTIVAPYRVGNTTEDGHHDLRHLSDTDLEQHGIYRIVNTPRPADTATTTSDRTGVTFDGATVDVVWTERLKTQAELDAGALNVRQTARRLDVEQAVSTLRTWSDQAANTTVTQGNAVATLQIMVDRLGVFFDRFADLVEVQYGEQ